ncbi:predicted protein [Nematostella vectensis]|uniref:Cationic amino acid transporter C-terminal domain-containing protein n=1 Tax=Nematostella vectensis TaxID=45351 RepID=A7S2Z0_NEMVE|nr:predicted protein [Nematostella vectensis]|eukprot:XP_001633926.1 predicted protein [Nematostella vectensis]
MSCIGYLRLLVRRKTKDIFHVETILHRCLNALDLTLLGVGSMLGAGLYIATGEIARSTAGPAIVISLLIGAIPVCLSSLCYAEFGSRISKTGSSYTYTYFAMGEIWAFIVGWNLILENIIAAALLGHESSRFLNSISGGRIYKFFTDNISNWQITGLLPFPDFVAFAIVMIFTTLASFGANRSAGFIRVAMLINVFVVVFVVLSGVYFVDTKNWTKGNFAPYGFYGIMSGAASSYFAYLGFDTLNTASEEAINPKHSIPKACNISTYLGIAMYLLTAGILTLMIPYKQLSPEIALPQAFADEGFPIGKYFVAVGGMSAMALSLLAYLFSGPRILYAMSRDGLMIKFFNKISYATQVPVRGVLFCGLTAASVSLFVNTSNLVEMLSIGTMLAYIAIAISVLLERHKPAEPREHEFLSRKTSTASNATEEPSCWRKFAEFCFRCKGETERHSSGRYAPIDTLHEQSDSRQPTQDTYHTACLSTACLVVGAFGFCLTVSPSAGLMYMREKNPYVIVVSCVFLFVALVSVVMILLQPRRTPRPRYHVPCVPLIPISSVVINEYLLTNLSKLTWASFTAWTFID